MQLPLLYLNSNSISDIAIKITAPIFECKIETNHPPIKSFGQKFSINDDEIQGAERAFWGSLAIFN